MVCIDSDDEVNHLVATHMRAAEHFHVVLQGPLSDEAIEPPD